MKKLNELTAVASGRKKADLVLHGAHVLNVFTKEFEKRDIAISGPYIAATGEPYSYEGEKEIKVDDKWIVPGFIDAHVHIESSMMMPAEFARSVAKQGTTCVIADSHEIANVLGPDAVRFMIHQSSGSDVDFFFMIPSCVPATDFEDTGGVISAEDIASLLKIPHVIGLGEMMNYPGIIHADDETLEKVRKTLEVAGKNAVIDGHIPLVTGKDLQAYCACSIKTDHESHTIKEVTEKIKNGMWILIRQGSSARDLEVIVPELIKSGLPLDRMCFCTDDKNIGDILLEGHINANIRNAIKLGMKIEDAYTMASFHTAQCYALPNRGAVCAGYKADFVVLDNPETVSIESVYKCGKKIDQRESKSFSLPQNPNGTESDELLFRACHSIHIKEPTKELFEALDVSRASHAIEIKRGSLNTLKYVLKDGEAKRGLKDGSFCRLSLIERHKMTGKHATALLKGYGLKKGAIAMSIGHDSHNIVCAGINTSEMMMAVSRLKELEGGICIVDNGNVVAELALPVAGLMSNLDAETVKNSHENLLPAARKLGIYEGIEPFVTLSFVSLPVIPEVRLTDRGLFDVINWKFI